MFHRGLCADKLSQTVEDLNLMIRQRLEFLSVFALPGSNKDCSHVVRLSSLEICQAITDKSLTRQTDT